MVQQGVALQASGSRRRPVGRKPTVDAGLIGLPTRGAPARAAGAVFRADTRVTAHTVSTQGTALVSGFRAPLTGDLLVTYCKAVDDDLVFKALADPTRRLLLDALFEHDGRNLGELEAVVAARSEMTRFGVSKHLRLLEAAGLVVTRKRGRVKLHYLNPVPIRLLHDRWIDKYTERRVTALTELKRQLEDNS